MRPNCCQPHRVRKRQEREDNEFSKTSILSWQTYLDTLSHKAYFQWRKECHFPEFFSEFEKGKFAPTFLSGFHSFEIALFQHMHTTRNTCMRLECHTKGGKSLLDSHFSVRIQTVKAWLVEPLVRGVSSWRCQSSYHRDNWLVATKRSWRRCFLILRCRHFLSLRRRSPPSVGMFTRQ